MPPPVLLPAIAAAIRSNTARTEAVRAAGARRVVSQANDARVWATVIQSSG